jgi:hypothetical protein
MDTLRFLDERRDRVATYIVGEFGLTHGSLVAQDPSKFGMREVWQLEGDRLGLSLFFEPLGVWKDDDDREAVDEALSELSQGWRLRPYPWAGAVSTAHTLLYYAELGASVFRDRAKRGDRGRILGAAAFEATGKFDLERVALAEERDAEVWGGLVHEERLVSRTAYAEAVAGITKVRARPTNYRFAVESDPAPIAKAVRGRRPSHAHNATKP